ncbi:glycosyltransferase 61 family protein [Primorskyibacter flagellatus]|uniref:Capsular polysaccharide biosynthesis protein n=1 Tax=Primorskyibacter flagellatus TaxID=1387277 RepID=A0A1W2DZV6_9RHOB|nr:glycosyltransferase family 61 protein [Primorskyibacter flagellatus]SMD03085.1 Capsular polysaccharide biosynthesis protein [Primorskyibacter flagellatus]
MATRSWEVCAAETLTCPSAIHLPDALDRVTALSPWRDWETERLYIEGGPVMHAATRAHLIQNVDINGAFLYCGAAKLRAGFGPQQLTHRHAAPRRNLPEAHLVSDWAGSHYFGLFLRASLPMELLPDAAENMISLPTKDYTHEAGYRKILERPRPPCVTAARVNRLILYNDFGHNPSKAARYAELRAALRRNLGGIAPQGKTGVYLKRGTTGERRRLANESQVEATLTALGFDIVEPAALDARTIAQRLLDAPIVVSVEGSHLSHAIYSIAEGGTLLVLQPPDRFAMAFKEFTNRGGLNFAFTVGHAAPDGFTVNPDDIKRTLDLLS